MVLVVGCRLREERGLETQDDRFGGDVLVRRPQSARLGTVAKNLSALIEVELDVGPRGVIRDELELIPERFQFLLTLVVEDQLPERGIIARVSHHVVEAGAQQADFVFRLVGIEAAAFSYVEGVGKQRAEFRERRFVAGSLAGGHDEVGVLHPRRVAAGQCLQRGQVFAVGTEADETVADRLAITTKWDFRFDWWRFSLDAERGTIEIPAVRRVGPQLPVHERLGSDAQSLDLRTCEYE